VADGARFEQATQLNMGSTGIGTFNDRLRDAVRGGGPFDGGADMITNQGVINGLYYDPNANNSGSGAEKDELLLSADQIRVGLAGNLADYQFIDRSGDLVAGRDVDYNGAPAGYTQDPQEHIVYVSAHDNQTLFDISQYKHPVDTTMADRVRAQNLGIDFTVMSQGVPFFHAGVDMLRSKSLDRDSFNSGDWFNKLDFTYQANNWGVGLPVAGKNQADWPVMQPLLADPALSPASSDIRASVVHMQEMLEIRGSSELFRLESEGDVQDRLQFHNTGPNQIPGLIVMSISDDFEPDLDPQRERIIVLINANDETQSFKMAAGAECQFVLHPVQQTSVDPVVRTSTYDGTTGTFTIPARTTAVFDDNPQERIGCLSGLVQDLVDARVLNKGQGNSLMVKLEGAIDQLDKGNPVPAVNKLNAFINEVDALVLSGKLTPEQGQPLIDAAQSIIDQIKG
jgi:pullulanase-type alpha-1,6-glucosidase